MVRIVAPGQAVWQEKPPSGKCWADLTPEQYRERIAELVEEIEADAPADREARGVEPMGVSAQRHLRSLPSPPLFLPAGVTLV